MAACCSTRCSCSPPCCAISAWQKGDRVIIYMPMVPEAVFAMLACARIGADALGGVRRLRGKGARDAHRRRQAEADPLGELRHRGRARRPLQAAARRGDRSGDGQAAGLHRSSSGRNARRALIAGPRSRLAQALRRSASTPARPASACRSRPPIRSTSSTRPARPAFRRAWCATMAATWSRSHGRCKALRRRAGRSLVVPPPTSAGWSGIPTSSMRRCFMAARRSSMRASRSARRTPARSGA